MPAGRPAARRRRPGAALRHAGGRHHHFLTRHARFAPAESRRRGGGKLGKARARRRGEHRGHAPRLPPTLAGAAVTAEPRRRRARRRRLDRLHRQGGDVWLATPDGARQQQVTHTGGYSNVSQADDGTMIALAPGERLHKLSRTGQVLADFLDLRQRRRAAGRRRQPVPRPVQPADLAGRDEGRLRVVQRHFYEAPGLLGARPSRRAWSTTRARASGSRVRRLHRPGGVRAADRLDLPALDVQRHAAALVLGRRVHRRRGLHARSAATPSTRGSSTTSRASASTTSSSRATCRPSSGSPASERREAARLPHDDVTRSARRTGTTSRSTIGNAAGRASAATSSTASSRARRSRPSGRALAYGTAEGISVAAIPAGCAPGDRGTLLIPGGRFPGLGPGRRPAGERLPGRRPGTSASAPVAGGGKPATATRPKLSAQARGKRLAVTLATGGAGKATVTAKRQAPHARQRRARQVKRLGHGHAADQAPRPPARQGDRQGHASPRPPAAPPRPSASH